MLNQVLRPMLSRWHPLLLDHEDQRPAGVSTAEHERAWPGNEELRSALADVRTSLARYAKLLAEVAGVPHA